jgi:hypothetical protein
MLKVVDNTLNQKTDDLLELLSFKDLESLSQKDRYSHLIHDYDEAFDERIILELKWLGLTYTQLSQVKKGFHRVFTERDRTVKALLKLVEDAELSRYNDVDDDDQETKRIKALRRLDETVNKPVEKVKILSIFSTIRNFFYRK